MEQSPEPTQRPVLARPRWEPDGLYSWLLLIVVGALALALGLGLVRLAWLLARPLALLVLGVTLAVALAPAVNWLCRWLPRLWAVILIYAVLGLALLGLGWLVTPQLLDQLQQFRDQLPQTLARVQQWLDQQAGRWAPELSLTGLAQGLSAQAGSEPGSSSLVSLPVSFFQLLLNLVLVVFISIYWLLALPAMWDFFLSLFPRSRRDPIASVVRDMFSDMGGYVRGAMLDAIIMAVLIYIGLLIIGVEYALVLALVGGFLEVIPIIGTLIASALIVGAALLQSTSLALITLVFMIVLQILEGNILVPTIMRRQAEVSPLLTLFAIFAGGAIGGVLGALVAIPLAAALQLLTREAIAPLVRRWTGASQPGEESPRQPRSSRLREQQRGVS